MKVYLINEATLQIPENWDDDTSNVFSPPEIMPGSFTLVVNRDTLEPHENLNMYANRQTQVVSTSLTHYKSLGQKDIQIDGFPALQTDFTWISDGDPVRQRQIFVARNQKILAFTITTGEESFTREAEETIKNILDSFKFRDDDSDE